MSLIETSELGEQIAEKIVGHCVRWVLRQGPPEHALAFLITILGQKRPRLPQATERRFRTGRRGAAEAADCLVAVAECVDQRAGAEPCLRQGGIELRGAVVGNDGTSNVA